MSQPKESTPDPILPDQGRAEKLKPFRPVPAQLVWTPAGLRGVALSAWFRADLEAAIGAEFIDRDGTEQIHVRKRKRA